MLAWAVMPTASTAHRYRGAPSGVSRPSARWGFFAVVMALLLGATGATPIAAAQRDVTEEPPANVSSAAQVCYPPKPSPTPTKRMHHASTIGQ